MTIGQAGEKAQTRASFKIVGPLKSLNGASTAQNGTAYSLGGAFSNFAVQCSIAGSTSAVVDLEGSIDGTNFKKLGASVTVDSTANNAITKSTNATPVCHARLRLVSRTTSSSTVAEAVSGWFCVS